MHSCGLSLAFLKCGRAAAIVQRRATRTSRPSAGRGPFVVASASAGAEVTSSSGLCRGGLFAVMRRALLAGISRDNLEGRTAAATATRGQLRRGPIYKEAPEHYGRVAMPANKTIIHFVLVTKSGAENGERACLIFRFAGEARPGAVAPAAGSRRRPYWAPGGALARQHRTRANRRARRGEDSRALDGRD
jgi:hypothetical protein